MKLADLKSYSTSHLNRRLKQKYGFGIKTANLSESRARQLLQKVEESIIGYKKQHGHLNSEKNSRYTELLLMRDGLSNWLREHNVATGRVLTEGELEQAQTKLAAKDFVDRLQKIVDDLSGMSNEDLPPLVSTMRDQLGADKAAAFNNAVNQSLTGLLEAAKQTRQAVEDAARMASGEQAAPMAAPMGGEMPPGGEEMVAPAPEGDEQAAADAAAGGAAELGRETR